MKNTPISVKISYLLNKFLKSEKQKYVLEKI